jgi:hypothetical protein
MVYLERLIECLPIIVPALGVVAWLLLVVYPKQRREGFS